MREGRGTLTFDNHDTYNGNWKRDMFCGEGELNLKSRNEYLKGIWF